MRCAIYSDKKTTEQENMYMCVRGGGHVKAKVYGCFGLPRKE